MNVQVAAALDGRVAAIGPHPVAGARHDAHAYAASGPAELLAGLHRVGDLGYTGVDGIDLVGYKRQPGQDLCEHDATFNKALSSLRAANERAVAHLNTSAGRVAAASRLGLPPGVYQPQPEETRAVLLAWAAAET